VARLIATDVLTAVEDGIYPAVAGYKDLLRGKFLAKARSDDQPGLKYVREGETLYRSLVQDHT